MQFRCKKTNSEVLFQMGMPNMYETTSAFTHGIANYVIPSNAEQLF